MKITGLDQPTIAQLLTRLPHWKLNEGKLQKTYLFKNFVEAIAFVNRLIAPSEALNHHPDITILFNRVTLDLSTHSVGCLTEKDFHLASQIEALDQ